jgi:hypothetical protein
VGRGKKIEGRRERPCWSHRSLATTHNRAAMVALSLDLAQAGWRREDVVKGKHDRERGRVFVPRVPPIAVASGSAGHGRESTQPPLCG